MRNLKSLNIAIQLTQRIHCKTHAQPSYASNLPQAGRGTSAAQPQPQAGGANLITTVEHWVGGGWGEPISRREIYVCALAPSLPPRRRRNKTSDVHLAMERQYRKNANRAAYDPLH